MIERKQGKGKLISRNTGKQYGVVFDFEITTEIVRTSHGNVATKKDSIGKVHAVDGSVLPVEDYDLYAHDGEIMHVRNVGFGEWVMEAM